MAPIDMHSPVDMRLYLAEEMKKWKITGAARGLRTATRVVRWWAIKN